MSHIHYIALLPLETLRWLCVCISGVRKNFREGVNSVTYGGHLYLVCALCDVTVWRHVHVFKSTFGEVCWHNRHIPQHVLPYFMCNCTDSDPSSNIGEKKVNATAQQFIIAKISDCVLKQGCETHASLHQSNLQPQNEATLMSCRILAVEHRKCGTGLSGTHLGLKDQILLNYTKIENAHKVGKKTFNIFLSIQV